MDNRIFFLINKVQRRMLNHADQACEQTLDTSVTQMAALFYITRHQGCVQKELGVALGLKKAAITGLLSRMESNDLISRSPCESDSRAMRLQVTEKGQQKVSKAAPLLVEFNQQIREGFSEEEISVVLRFLNTMLERF